MGEDIQRKKSPRAPSISLEDAIQKALKVYEKERRHPAPGDAVAQDLGYKDANNGAALRVIASLRYYGLLERIDGKLAVSKDVESYQYSPSEGMRRELLVKWVKTPPVFMDLLEKFPGGLPSDASVRFELIQGGFSPAAAEDVLGVLKQSIAFAHYFENNKGLGQSSQEASAPAPSERAENFDEPPAIRREPSMGLVDGLDRIPVRLRGGRRAWLEIPTPFYEADKHQLKAQIDLLITEDEPPLA